jgi:hypothetical protein
MTQIYHTFPFTTCFGLMGPSSGKLGLDNRLFLFLLLSPHWPVFTHWECVVCMLFMPFLLWNVLLMGYLKYWNITLLILCYAYMPETGVSMQLFVLLKHINFMHDILLFSFRASSCNLVSKEIKIIKLTWKYIGSNFNQHKISLITKLNKSISHARAQT